MVSAPVVRDRNSAFCDERLELQAVLSSPLFQRAPKLSRILAYVCEQYFTGKAADLKEYSIAIDALGRAPGFDPQADAIVRVDLHLLRKRLELFYAQDGKNRRARIILPLGQYTPEFVARDRVEMAEDGSSDGVSPACDAPLPPAASKPVRNAQGISSKPLLALPSPSSLTSLRRIMAWSRHRTLPLVAASCCLLGLTVGAGGTLVLYRRHVRSQSAEAGMRTADRRVIPAILPRLSFGAAPDFEDQAIRIRCGSNQDYVDSSGQRWSMDRYYAGGTSFRRTVTQIFRSEDPILYSTGRQGVFQYDVPVPPGAYEVRLLFAETAPGIEDGVRQNSFDVGAGVSETLDVVSDAGGARTATMKIYSNVRPGADGKIPIRFWSSDAFLNALEIVPAVNGKPGPVRISTLPRVFVDPAGKHWLSDRYFLGGRNINHTFTVNRADSPLFSRERYGSFSYAIPVAEGFSYQLTLYMAERYWGAQNSGAGGIGSRVFDVRCNGLELLQDFDLLKASKHDNVVAVRFRDLRPDSNDKLNLDFVPVVNYAVVNALEVEPE